MRLFSNLLKILSREKNFDSVITKSENALKILCAPSCTKRFQLKRERVANRVTEEQINDISTFETIQQVSPGAGYPVLRYFSKSQFKCCHEKHLGVTKIWNKYSLPLIKQLSLKQNTSVSQLDISNFRHALRKVNHVVIMLYTPWYGYCKTIKSEFALTAEQFISSLMNCIAASNSRDSFHTVECPTINYFSYIGKTFKCYGARNEVDFASFIHTQMMHATNQVTKAATTPQAAGFGSNVELSFDADFERKIAGSEPTFVMFYASWCSHCVAVKPTFSRLATKVKESNIRLRIIAVDAAENPKVADIAGIQTLPTFKIFKNGKEQGLYEGDRSMEDMLKFCESFMK